MNDWVVDSCVAAKWVLDEDDSGKARTLVDNLSGEDRLIVLDLVFPEVSNVIWKRHQRGLVTAREATELLERMTALPLSLEPASKVLEAGLRIALKYDRSVYDALFVALVQQNGARGVTADEPLYRAVHADFPQISLLRNL